MADANSQWYYGTGGEQHGPVGIDQMRALAGSGTINRDTLVWTQTMTSWQPLGQSELAGMLGSGPPSMAPRVSPSPQGLPPAPGQWTGAPPNPYGMNPAGPYAPSPGFVDAIKICFAKYATFAGRATRPEFWWFTLFYMIVITGVSMLGGVLTGAMVSGDASDTATGAAALVGVGLQTIAMLVLLLPQLSATVRRLHDTDRSGWFYWMILIPLAGPIILLVFLCSQGTPGRNKFG